MSNETAVWRKLWKLSFGAVCALSRRCPCILCAVAEFEQIARYIVRNPFSTAKMHFEPGAGSVLYRSRMNKKQRDNFAALSPTDFIAAVTQHIPDKGFQLVRYYGWYSNKARGVRAKTGAAQAEDSAQGHEPDRAPTSAQ